MQSSAGPLALTFNRVYFQGASSEAANQATFCERRWGEVATCWDNSSCRPRSLKWGPST